jgi:hypothetical protein
MMNNYKKNRLKDSKKKNSNKKIRDNDSRNNTIIFIKIILWPFKIIFKTISFIGEKLIRGIDYLINIFLTTNTKGKRKDNKDEECDADASKGRPIYTPFKIIDTKKGTFQGFETFVSKNPSTIGLILGARGTGKTALGLKLIENVSSLNSKKKSFAMGFRGENLPKWLRSVEKIDDLENDSIVLIDEGGILFSSRKSLSDANRLLSEILLIARHKDLSVIFISQNSSNIDINVIRQADYIMLKPSSLLQKDFERSKIRQIYDEVEEQFHMYRKIKGITYLYSESFRGFASNSLPSFWSDKVSKSFRDSNKHIQKEQ